MNKQRLLNVAKAVRESIDPESFLMAIFGKAGRQGRPQAQAPSCGTPCCTLGHYAARADLQDDFKLCNDHIFLRDTKKGDLGYACSLGYNFKPILDHFDILAIEADVLFGPHGCGGAESTEAAAVFIERYVAEEDFIKAIDVELGL